MNNKLSLTNFKSFKNEVCTFSQINLIAGSNSIGKTTLLEAIYIFSKAINFNDEKYIADLDIRGICFDDINCIDNIDREPVILKFNENILKLEYKARNDMKVNITKNIENEKLISYFKSERTISQDQVILSSNLVDEINSKNLAWQILEHEIEDKLFSQMQEVFDMSDSSYGIEIKTISVPTYTVKYDILLNNRTLSHHGYGLKQVLPLLVQSLIMNNGILLIENPENFLHPSAQSNLIKLLIANCEENNNILIIESHSDHVINAYRKYMVEKNDKSKIIYIEQNQIKEMKIGDDKKFTEFPKGFLDQTINDMKEIYGL